MIRERARALPPSEKSRHHFLLFGIRRLQPFSKKWRRLFSRATVGGSPDYFAARFSASRYALAAFFAAKLRLRVAAAFLAAALRLRFAAAFEAAVFLAAAFLFLVRAAFLAAALRLALDVAINFSP